MNMYCEKLMRFQFACENFAVVKEVACDELLKLDFNKQENVRIGLRILKEIIGKEAEKVDCAFQQLKAINREQTE